MEGGNDTAHSSMQTDEDKRGCKTLAGCAEHFLLNGTMSDVTFSFKGDGGQEPLKAHRLILNMRSDKFEKKFQMVAANNEIEVNDIDREIFELLLRFIYTDQVNLTGDTVLKCMREAKNFCLGGLEKMCSDFLENSIAPENVCTIYEQSKSLRVEDQTGRCKMFITENAESVFMSEDIRKLSYDSLLDLMSDDKLQSDEIIQFDMALRWADGKCKADDIEPSGENKRKVLGEIIEKIRFPVIAPETFVKKVIPTKLLLPDEQIELLQFMVTMTTDTPGHVGKFLSIPRKNALTMNLNDVGSRNTGQANGEEICLMSNCDIALLELSDISKRFVFCIVKCKEDSSQNNTLNFDFFDYSQTGGILKPAKGNSIKLEANKRYKLNFRYEQWGGGFPKIRIGKMNRVVKFGELSVTILKMPLNMNSIKFCRV